MFSRTAALATLALCLVGQVAALPFHTPIQVRHAVASRTHADC